MKRSHLLRILGVAALACTFPGVANAQWTTLALPNTIDYGNTTMGHLSNGLFLYGHSGSLRQQNSFGNNASTAFTNAFAGDYAFVTSTFAASGAWGGGPIDSFAGSNTASAFTAIGTYQNYAGINRGAGLLLVGTNGGGSKSSLGYLTTANVFTSLIGDISTYSGGFAMAANGDVYVADDDDKNIYRFTSLQIDTAISGTPLLMTEGTLVANLGVSGSLAFDSSSNRLYATGWQQNGIQVYDINSSQSSSLIPDASNANYQVMVFGDGSNSYVGWLNRSGWAGGDTVTYGYALSDTVPLPEPNSLVLLVLGCGLFLLIRKLRKTNRSANS